MISKTVQPLARYVGMSRTRLTTRARRPIPERYTCSVGEWHKADMVVSLVDVPFGGRADTDWSHFNVRL
jgi:hypothetical protein